ncbi:MAG: ATP-binding protein [Clostridia bacterium]|nr:ATP-binding protein [Clostridia bacterium]
MIFVGRENELNGLEQQYRRPGFEFSVIYGRRRIGKTYLIRQYIADKPAIFFTGLEAGSVTNLELFSQVVHQMAGQEGLAAYRDFAALFSAIAAMAHKRRMVLVIDEYPYLAAAAPEISSLLQKFCDHDWQDTKLHLILCGSSMSFMERQVLGAKSPLYGRRTAQYRLMPFSYFESRQYLSDLSAETAAILHAATGGVAEYLSFVDQDRSLADNLIALFLSSTGRLFEEPGNLLKQELREPRVYNDLLDAIAGGATKSNEIATKAQMHSGALNHYLESLIDLGIVSKEKPFQNEQSRKTVYRISDGCFRFWYRYVMPNINAIQAGLGRQVYDKIVQPDLPAFMGQGFEQIFFDYFDRLNATGALPDLFIRRGRWWGNNPSERREEEIDLVASGTQMTCFGEAKWRQEKVDAAVLKLLEQRGDLIPARQRYFICLSKSGFTEGAREYVQGRADFLLSSFSDLDGQYVSAQGPSII